MGAKNELYRCRSNSCDNYSSYSSHSKYTEGKMRRELNMTIDRKETKITPMYIVGTINDSKFKQALHYSGHSGNRLFSRKRDAVNFYSYEKRNHPNLEIHIYEITQVSDCTEDIENDEKA